MPTGKEIAEAVLRVLQPLLGKLGDRLKALETRPAFDPQSVKEAVEMAVKAVPRLTVAEAKEMVERCVKEAVAQVRAPQDGEPGRDALQIEILPSIDVARSYARGTYASWRGGVVRAARTTDYLDELKDGETIETKGWQIVLAGIAEQSIEQIDARTFVMRQVDTAGRVVEKRATLPVLVYRGIWREGAYVVGDVVTWGGSAWHCDEPTTDKPGTGKGWRLMVKRGADAKMVARVDS